jgi:hypothetical protein
MYKIIDLQGVGTKENRIFETLEDIIEELADYHDIDYEGVKENNEPYKNIWEFLNTLKDDTERLNWLCCYGEWKVEELKSECCNVVIFNNGFDIIDLITRNYHLECSKCGKLFEIVA